MDKQSLQLHIDILRKLLEEKEKVLAEFEQVPSSLEEELDRIEKSAYCKPTYHVKNRVVVASVWDIPEAKVGIAICGPDDIFDLTTGKLIALKRALGIKFDARQYGNSKKPDYTKHEDYGICQYCTDYFVSVSNPPCNRCKHTDSGNEDNWRPALRR